MIEEVDLDEDIKEHWIEINGNEKLSHDIDLTEVNVDKASARTRDKVVNWFTKHEDSYLKGYLYINTKTSEVDNFTIKDLHHKGDMTREHILNFFETFSGMHNTQIVEREHDSNKTHLRVHFD